MGHITKTSKNSAPSCGLEESASRSSMAVRPVVSPHHAPRRKERSPPISPLCRSAKVNDRHSRCGVCWYRDLLLKSPVLSKGLCGVEVENPCARTNAREHRDEHAPFSPETGGDRSSGVVSRVNDRAPTDISIPFSRSRRTRSLTLLHSNTRGFPQTI
jgi:hypothetical protein